MLEFNFSVAEESDGPAHITVEVFRVPSREDILLHAIFAADEPVERVKVGELYATLEPDGRQFEVWDALHEEIDAPPIHYVPSQEDFVLWVMFEVEPGLWTQKEGGE